jgi:hypothetical protein
MSNTSPRVAIVTRDPLADRVSGRFGAETDVLCEIDASSVSPTPDEAPREIARTLSGRLATAPISPLQQ